MKKSNLISFALLFAVGIILTANTGLCVEDLAQQVPAAAAQIPAKTGGGVQLTVSKFIVTMIGVLLSSVVIWGGLTVYNKFFAEKNIYGSSNDDEVLRTPKTVEEAVTFFIKRNKLK